MLETQGQMKTPSEEREQEKQNKAMQDLLLLLKDEPLTFGEKEATYQEIIDQCSTQQEIPKTVEEKVVIPSDIQALLIQGREAELTPDQLAELEKLRKPIT
jgi:hypothetical protein